MTNRFNKLNRRQRTENGDPVCFRTIELLIRVKERHVDINTLKPGCVL